jgi:hypothetical protein
MNKLMKAIAKVPILGHTVLGFYRMKIALGYFQKPLFNLTTWLFTSNETTNFTYDLETNNIRYLASLIADIVNIETHTAMGYINEIKNDNELRKHISDTTAKSDFVFRADNGMCFGRRIGWYAFARALKPRIIIETGVDKGLGACLLTAALKKNSQEGYEGYYYGTEINPSAGYLLAGDYANFGRIIYGDSIEALEKFDGVIDLFINDSDHSEDYEAEEYRTISNKLSGRAIILGDNSHVTDKLLEFSLRTNRHFVFFQEKPKEHWYPGAGIGISFRR